MIEYYEGKYGKQITLKIKPTSDKYNITLAAEDLLNTNNYNLSEYAASNTKPTVIVNANQKFAANQNISLTVNGAVDFDLNGKTVNFVYNNGSINVTSNGTINALNNGSMTIAERKEVKTTTLVNYKDITVNGNLINTGAFTNHGTVTVGDNGQVNITSGYGTLDITAVSVKASGEQNHIEVVNPAYTTVKYKTAEGDLLKLSKTLNTILATHILTGAKSIEVETEAAKLTNSETTTDPVINMTKVNITTKAEVTVDADYSKVAKVIFDSNAIVKGLKAGAIEVKAGKQVEVLAGAAIEISAASVIDGTVVLYENAALKGGSYTGSGLVKGYLDQITSTIGGSITKQGHL